LSREFGVAAVKIETEAGVIACERLGPWSYRVDMGAPRLEWDAIPLRHAVTDTRRVKLWADGEGPAELGSASAVNMGNPHAVFFVPNLERIEAAELGSSIEVDPMFPEKANVTFAQVLAQPGGELLIEWRASDDHVLMTGPVEYEGAFILDDALFEAAAP
jgi:diaminopimelate epimerase